MEKEFQIRTLKEEGGVYLNKNDVVGLLQYVRGNSLTIDCRETLRQLIDTLNESSRKED